MESVKKLTPQTALEQAYQYECRRSEDWKALATALEHDYWLMVAECNEARFAIKIVVFGILACMLAVIYILIHYGIKV